MKYFGQYLVSKGIISSDVLTDALIEQMVSLPTVVEIIRKKNILKSEVLLNIFACQTEKQIDFKKACFDLGVWTSEIDSVIKQELESLRVPIGQILIKRGSIDLPTMTKALDEFLSRVEAPTQPSPIQSKSEISSSAESAETVSVSATQTQEPSKIDPLLLEEVVSYLTLERLEGIKSNFLIINDLSKAINKEVISNALKQLFTDFRTLHGLLKFIQLEKTESLVSRLELLILRSIEQSDKGDTHLLPVLSSLGIKGVELLSALKSALVEHQSEEAWVKHSEWSSKINEFLSKFADVFESEKIKETPQ